MKTNNPEILSLDELINIHVSQDLKEINDKDASKKERKLAIRHALKLHTERERTWTLYEVMDCLRFGYKLTLTVKLGDFKGGVCDVTEPTVFKQLVKEHGDRLKPRYLSYKEEIFILIERFIVEWPAGRFAYRVYIPKHSAYEMHTYLFSKHRMTEADYDRLILGII